MHNYLKVKGYDGLVRDVSTGAIVNTNTAEYNRYIKQKNAALEQRNEILQQKEEINNIRKEVSEIKDLLTRLLEKQLN